MLSYIVKKSNEGLMAEPTVLFDKVLENKLSNLVAKVYRTYQRELKRHVVKPQRQECYSLEDLKDKHNNMRKAAHDLFIDQVRSGLGISSQKLADSSTDQIIAKFQRILATNIHQHYKTVKEELIQEQKIVSATVLIQLYKKIILSKTHSSVTTYLKDWQKLQTEYFSRVPGQFKYEEWSKFSLETLRHGIQQINLR